MKVLLVNPPSPPEFPISRGLMGGFGMAVGPALVYPPLSAAYCAAVLLEAGHEAAVVDAVAEGLDRDQTVARAEAFGPDLTAVVTSSASIRGDLETAAAIRKVGGGISAVLGAQVTHAPEALHERFPADYAIRGEPEGTLLALVSALDGGEDTRDLAGISIWRDGAFEHHPDAEPLGDLDALPFPARHLLPMDRYGIPDMGKPFTTILSSRGCPINCGYCGYTLSQGTRWRGRSATNVADEIEDVHRRFGVRYLVFRDPLFSFRMDRVAELCRLLMKRRLDVEWQCETAFRYLDAELLDLMGRARCRSVSLGAESADEAIRKKYSRAKLRSVEHAAEVIRACRKCGIRTRVFFMLGFPEDTRETVRATADLARRLDPDSVQFTAVTPYPGTPLHASLKDRIEIPFDALWGYEPVGVCERLSPAELRVEIKRAYRRFYARPGRILKEAASPGKLWRRLRRYLGMYEK